MDIGVDIVEIDRIAKSVKKSSFFETRLCSQRSGLLPVAQKFRAAFCRAAFAAERGAVWKAVGEPALLHRDIQVRNQASGKPIVVFPARFKKFAKRLSISLSHGREYAVAMAVFQ